MPQDGGLIEDDCRCTVRPTLEVVLTEVPSTLRGKNRADLGIALIDIGAT
jgi:hypothetical protein